MIPSFPWAFCWTITIVMLHNTWLLSGTSANRLGPHDDGYLDNGYLRSGKRYSPDMHSYQAGYAHNVRRDDSDRYIARNLQKAPDHRLYDDDDRDGRSRAYMYGRGSLMGQHYPAKSTYIKPTPATSTTAPVCTTPSCVTVTTSTTISRLVAICQLPTTYALTGTAVTPDVRLKRMVTQIVSSAAMNIDTVLLYSSETGTCTFIGLPSKLTADCCSGPSTASSYEPCYTTTFVRTILKGKTCTMSLETFLYKDATLGWFDGQPTSTTGKSGSIVTMATTCRL